MAVIWGIEIFGPLIEQHGEGAKLCPLLRSLDCFLLVPASTTSQNMVLSDFQRVCVLRWRRAVSGCRCCAPDSSGPRSWTHGVICPSASIVTLVPIFLRGRTSDWAS